MRAATERLWVSFVNSPKFRQLTASTLGAALFESDTAHRLNMARRYVATYISSRSQPNLFRDLQTFCLFIGHTKSGSSMLGSMLDAHPNAIIADGSDALQYVPIGFVKEQLFHILLKCSRREAMKGRVTARRLTPYSFAVPNQWQGQYRKLQVIGDTTSETAIRRIAMDPYLLDGLQKMMDGVEVKFIQVIRNPFDPISVMMIRGKRSIENAVERYFSIAAMLAEARQHLTSTNLLEVRYEDVVHRPQENLARVCHYLGLTPSAEYVNASTSILHAAPERTRDKVTWPRPWVDVVEQKIGQFDFLEGYSFAN